MKPYSNENGELYAIPVSLTEIQGPVSTIGLSSKFIILLDKPLIQSVPFMNTTNAVKPAKDELWGVTTNEWSLEAWVRWTDSILIIRLYLFGQQRPRGLYPFR